MQFFFASCILQCVLFLAKGDIDEEEEKLPTKCHVCKHLVQELQDELKRSARSNEVFRTGQIFQEQRKEINYQTSEVRLNEALENACTNVLDYKVHKDKVKALRYEKKESVTFNTLKGLKNRGVKVDLGFPDEMWDSPDAEVTRLKSRCELMVEKHEDDLEEWYWNHQMENLTHWLCIERVLDPGEEECFNETEQEKKSKDEDDSENEEARDGKGKDQGKKAGTKGEGGKKKSKVKQPQKKEKQQSKKGKSSKQKTQGKKNKKPSNKKGETSPDREDDSEKIQRLIKEQATKQEETRKNRKKHSVGKMDERKRRELQLRLRDIHDVDRLRRELRKIRTQEMTEDDYVTRQPWEDDLDTRLPEDVRREMRSRRLDRMDDDPEDLRRELQMKVLDAEDDLDGPRSFNFRDLRHRYMDEAEDIRDPRELRKRIDDLDALSAIFDGGRRGRHGRGRRDEL